MATDAMEGSSQLVVSWVEMIRRNAYEAMNLIKDFEIVRKCNCTKLERVVAAAKSLLSEDDAKEALAHYVVLQIMADAIDALESD